MTEMNVKTPFLEPIIPNLFIVFENLATCNGLQLRNMHFQTHSICLAAVKNNGMALRYVLSKTPDICWAAIEQNGLAIQFIDNPTEEMCDKALMNNIHAMKYIQNVTSKQQAILAEKVSDIAMYLRSKI